MLELINVSSGYDGQDTIRDVSLTFQPGRIYTVVGRNGCGKSTLLKTCAGLLRPSGGSILLDERELGSYAPVERARRISYLSQSRNTPGISVERLVEHGRYPRLASPRRLNAEDRMAVENAMEIMQVTNLRHKNMHELSGGEQQRVYLAMQLSQDASVLLLDEPTTYMDIDYQLSLLDLLHQLRESGKTIILVLHDLQQALNVSDGIIVMDNGSIVSAASPDATLSGGVLERTFHVWIDTAGNPTKGYVLNMEKLRR